MTTYPRTMDLVYWITERENIRIRRENGVSAPWTLDPAMANVRYCNVRREDDKVTKWIRNSSVYSGADISTWRVVLARMVNRIRTLELIAAYVDRGSLDEVKTALKIFRDTGPIWGNAYTISTCGKSMDKVDYVIDHVVQAVAEAGEPDFDSLATCYENLTNIDGLGSFLAAQVVADLKNTPGHPLQQAQDWRNWCAPGPGSLKGLAAFWGRTSTPGTFASDIKDCYNLVVPLLPAELQAIHMQDFQNCMCEFSKFIRVREGGRARNTYHAT